MERFSEEQKEWIFNLIDTLFHLFASRYRTQAKDKTKDILTMIDKLEAKQ